MELSQIGMALDRIADVTKVALNYDNGDIKGLRIGTYRAMPGLDLPIVMTAKKMFSNEQTGVLFQVSEDLWMLVAHYGRTMATTSYLIDASKCKGRSTLGDTPDFLLLKRDTLRKAVEELRSAILKSFIWKDRQWHPMELPT